MTEQWIALIESCSYKSDFLESISRKAGVNKLCQATDSTNGENNGWIIFNDNREESLVVSFRNAVFINEICIYENLNPGSVIRLEMLESRRSKSEQGEREKKIIFSCRSMVDNVATKISDTKPGNQSTDFSTDFTAISSSIEYHSCDFRSSICRSSWNPSDQ